VKTWELPSGDLEAVRSFSALAEARSVLLTRDGRFAVALYADGARVVPLEDGATAPVSVTGVAHAALLRGDGAVLSLGSEVREVSLAAPTEVRAAHPLPVAVSALASDAQGRAVAALADGSVFAVGRGADATRELVRLPAAAERLVASPGGTWLVAMGADRKTWVVDTRSREVRPLEDSWRIEDAAFVRDDALVFHRREDPSAFRLSLAHLQIEPWFGQGRFLNALEAAPGVSEAAVAQSGDVLLIPSPISGNAYTSESTRLVHRRFRGAR
jgi:hypothetical protein